MCVQARSLARKKPAKKSWQIANWKGKKAHDKGKMIVQLKLLSWIYVTNLKTKNGGDHHYHH